MANYKLPAILIGNASFSLCSGAIMLCYLSNLSNTMSIDQTILQIVGISLIPFALYVFSAARLLNKKMIVSIILLDLLWVIGSLVLLIVQPIAISATGKVIITTIAIIVCAFALMQWKFLKSSNKD